MTTSDPLKEVTALLRDAVGDPGDVDVVPKGREETIMRVAEALRARGRARRRKRVMMACSLAAAGLLLVVGGAFALFRAQPGVATGGTAAGARSGRDLGRLVVPTGAATTVRDGRNEVVEAGARLAAGTELWTTGAAEATLEFDNGTHVAVGGLSRVRFLEQTSSKRFVLAAGSFFCEGCQAEGERALRGGDVRCGDRGARYRLPRGDRVH